ncbi:MAG: PEP/pyruvate-binding domain-containing protein [Desulfotomaculaceae bacterium]|nr:PEP/pyruvate-binding domain-containing protein [Desulfotomaculaceae bacterium]
MSNNKNVYWLEEIEPNNMYIAGRKCCGLGEMSRNNLPVPPGFAVSLYAYQKFIDETGLGKEILAYFKENRKKMAEDVGLFEEAHVYIDGLVNSKPMPTEIEEDILNHYRELSQKCQIENVSVAVRSSGPVSMPGQFDTFLNVKGEEALLKHVIKVWASSFNARAMSYRLQRNMPIESSPIGVAVLKMVNAKSSGVMFTLDPLNGDRSKIFIEGSWGLGESLVSGQVTPDKYTVDKVLMTVNKRVICNKAIEMNYDPEGNIVPVDVEPDRQEVSCLSDEEILQVACLGKRVEQHYKLPQDIEWALDKDFTFPDNIFLLQTRPETIWNKKEAKPIVEPKKSALEYITSNLLTGKKLG